MNLYQGFRLAFKSIMSNKMRSILTMLGMIIGVASVIIIVGLMQGVANYLVDSFADLGTNQLTVSIMASGAGTRRVEESDMFSFATENNDIFQSVSPMSTMSATAKNGTITIENQSVTGVAETYESINRLILTNGRFLSYADLVNRKPVCVIGTYIVKKLFENNNPLGQTIKINGENFTIIGITKETADGEEATADDCIYAPYTKIARLSYTGSISSYTFSAYTNEMVAEAEKRLDSFLYDKLLNQDRYKISTMAALLKEITTMTGVMASVLSGIAGISLLVAGIGIMNIMLVSVTERTQEIGIRKSLGARQRDILIQFIIEAGSISTLGGAIGIMSGAGLVFLSGTLMGVRAAPTAGSMILSFSISVGIGFLFGYMPAKKAARLNPIDALRSE